MSFGNDVIVFKHLQKSGTADEDGNFQMTTVLTSAPGCRHRPLSFQEQADLGYDVETEMWKSTVPLLAYDNTVRGIVMGAKGNDVINVNGKDYQIIGGVRPHGDMDSVPFKMTIISKYQSG